MSLVSIVNIVVLDNPAPSTNPFQFEITFECLQELQDDLEWGVTYVGNAENSKQDQVLEEAMVGPVPVGINRFILQAPPPNHSIIQNQDLIGVTVILLSCSYLNQKFVQIGYFVNNEYAEPFEPENYPNPVDIAKLYRSILADEPRVTRFPIDWTGNNPMTYEQQGSNQQHGGVVPEESEEIMDMDAMDEDDEESDEDDEESNQDNNGEIDLGEEDDEEEEEGDEMDDDEEDNEDGDAFDVAGEQQMIDRGDLVDNMEIINNDSNSIDIARMLQK